MQYPQLFKIINATFEYISNILIFIVVFKKNLSNIGTFYQKF